jgi:hypothetical protein
MLTRTLAVVALTVSLSASGQQVGPAPEQDSTAKAMSSAQSSHAHGGKVHVTPDMLQQVAALQVLFAKYGNIQKALDHGYKFVPPCVSDPQLGGMGDHYSRDADNDFGRGDGTYALERPQYLVYAPRKNGTRRLAALDYTVPYEKWTSNKPPGFFGIPFTRNDGFGVWMFHIWVFEDNPAGMFANFNPRVPQC